MSVSLANRPACSRLLPIADVSGIVDEVLAGTLAGPLSPDERELLAGEVAVAIEAEAHAWGVCVYVYDDGIAYTPRPTFPLSLSDFDALVRDALEPLA